jgi:hypothetical protein
LHWVNTMNPRPTSRTYIWLFCCSRFFNCTCNSVLEKIPTIAHTLFRRTQYIGLTWVAQISIRQFQSWSFQKKSRTNKILLPPSPSLWLLLFSQFLPYNFIKISYRMKISGVEISEMNRDLIHLTGSLLSVSPLLLFGQIVHAKSQAPH